MAPIRKETNLSDIASAVSKTGQGIVNQISNTRRKESAYQGGYGPHDSSAGTPRNTSRTGSKTTVNDIAKAAANTARGVFKQATTGQKPRAPISSGNNRTTTKPKTAVPRGGRRETINPQYEALLRVQGRMPNSQGSYSDWLNPQIQRPMGRTGQTSTMPMPDTFPEPNLTGGGQQAPSQYPPADDYGWTHHPANSGPDWFSPEMWVPSGGWDDNPQGLTPPRGNWGINNLPPGWRYVGDPGYPFDPTQLAPM